MKRYTQKEAKTDIALGFAMDGEELYSRLGGFCNGVLGHVEKVRVGYGKYGINCGLVRTSQYGYVAFKCRSSAIDYAMQTATERAEQYTASRWM